MRGFTIIELLLVMVLAAVLLGLAIPSFRVLHANIATATESQRLLSLLRLARIRATSARAEAVLCPLAEDDTPGCATEFTAGWLVFLDASRDGAFDAGVEEVLRAERVPARRALRVVDGRGDAFTGSVTYRPDGTVARPATLRLCTAASRRGQRLVVSMTGRVRTAREVLSCGA